MQFELTFTFWRLIFSEHKYSHELVRYRPASDVRGKASGKSNESQAFVSKYGFAELESLGGNRMKRNCKCTIGAEDELLMGWEMYKPAGHNANSKCGKSSSTAALKRLLENADNAGRRKGNAGRRTVLSRLIEMMKAQPPKPSYSYGNCLQQTLNFNEREKKYEFTGNIEYPIPDIEEIYLNAEPIARSRRKNPFVEIQLSPKSMYNIQQQPPGREYILKRNGLMDPQNLFREE